VCEPGQNCEAILSTLKKQTIREKRLQPKVFHGLCGEGHVRQEAFLLT
jgi:hypothetical protein